MILITCCVGFIGSNFVIDRLVLTDESIINLDTLNYTGEQENLIERQGDTRHIFVHGDRSYRELVGRFLMKCRPRTVLYFAAKSHVDHSNHNPKNFIYTNIVSTFHLLKADKTVSRFLHVSTDEIFCKLGPTDAPLAETNRYESNCPYSASKASSDHLVRT